jgi:hypothetical protein
VRTTITIEIISLIISTARGQANTAVMTGVLGQIKLGRIIDVVEDIHEDKEDEEVNELLEEEEVQ